MFESLKFWKKKETVPTTPNIAPPDKPPGLDEAPLDLAGPEMPGLPSEAPARPTSGLAPEQAVAFRREAGPPEMPSPLTPPAETPGESGKDFQLINAKLDTIKAGIDHINARLDKMEQPKEEKEIIAWR